MHELFDTRELVCQVQDMITNNGKETQRLATYPGNSTLRWGVATTRSCRNQRPSFHSRL